MLDVYSIGTTLKLTDMVTPNLVKLGREFQKVDAVALQVNKRLQKMGQEIVGLKNLAAAAGKLDAGLKGVTTQATLAERALHSIRGAIPSGGIGLEKELTAANAEALILERRLAAMRAGRLGFGGGGGAGGGGGGGGGAGHPGGRRHRGGVHGGNIHVGSGGIGMGGVGVGLMSEMLVPAAGAMMAAYVGHAFYEGAKGYENEFMRFKSLNLGDQVNEEADKFVRGTRTFGVAKLDLMKAMAESVGLFGSFEEATKFTPALVELGRANAAVFGGKNGHLDEAGLKGLLKFIDRRGGFKDEERFKRNLNLAEKLVTGSGGFLKFNDLDQFSQHGGVAFRGLSDEGLLRMEGLMIEQGGSKAATSMMSMYQNLVAGRTPKKTMHLLETLGIGRIVQHSSGTVGGKKSTSNSFEMLPEYSALLQSNPAEFFGVVVPQLLAKQGITKDADVLKATNDILSNRNASNQGSIMTTQQFQLLRDYKLAKGAMGSDQVIDMYKGSTQGAQDDFVAAWADFKKEFGSTMLPAITDMLKKGADIMRTIASFNETDTVKGARDFTSGALHAFAWPYRLVGKMFGGGGGDDGHAAKSVAAPSGQANGTLHATLNFDGKKVAQAVVPYMARHIGSGVSTSSVDNFLSLPMPGVK